MTTIDSIDLGTREGFDIRADIVPDNTYYAEPDGDYTPEQVAAFKNGDWHYVGIIVTASRGDVALGSDSLWAVEKGMMPLDSEISEYIDPLRDEHAASDYFPDMIDNAVAEARLNLTELVDDAIDGSI